jgi:formate dehydrogenase subunit delta
MSAKTIDKLIYMANQIANAFRHTGDQPDEATWDHIWHFWDPRMKDMIIDHARNGGEGLNEIAKLAVKHLEERRNDPPPQTKATEFSTAHDPDLLSDAG